MLVFHNENTSSIYLFHTSGFFTALLKYFLLYCGHKNISKGCGHFRSHSNLRSGSPLNNKITRLFYIKYGNHCKNRVRSLTWSSVGSKQIVISINNINKFQKATAWTDQLRWSKWKRELEGARESKKTREARRARELFLAFLARIFSLARGRTLFPIFLRGGGGCTQATN